MAQPTVATIHSAISNLSTILHTKYLNLFTDIHASDLLVPPGRKHFLFPTGTLACGLWQPGDDVRLVCLSESREATFWAMVFEHLELQNVAMPEDATLELSDRGLADKSTSVGAVALLRQLADLGRTHRCSIYLHYAILPDVQTKNDSNGITISDYPSQSSPTKNILTNLQAVLRTQQLALLSEENQDRTHRTLPSAFTNTYHNLHSWAKSWGLLGLRVGLLSSEDLLLATRSAYETRDSPEKGDKVHVLDWVPGLKKAIAPPIVSPSMRLAVWHALELSHEALEETRNPISLQKAAAAAPPGGMPQGDYMTILRDFKCLITITCMCWQPSPKQQDEFAIRAVPTALREIIKYVENKANSTNNLHLRLWPIPFRGSDGKIVYVAGLWQRDHTRREKTTPRYPSHDSAVVDQVLEELWRDVTKNYETEWSRIHVSAHAGSDLLQELPALCRDESPSPPPTETPQHLNPLPLAPTAIADLRPGSALQTKKLPTAHQAISRLRHDPKYAETEHLVGYEDRFEGVMWVPLEEWGGKVVEDEDFIPEHRVRLIKRRVDEVVVWDRIGRSCLIGNEEGLPAGAGVVLVEKG